jgi:hypothetical protein
MQGDLRWLVAEGYVTEFIDGRLFAPPPMVEARNQEVETEEHDPENFPEAPVSNPPFATGEQPNSGEGAAGTSATVVSPPEPPAVTEVAPVEPAAPGTGVEIAPPATSDSPVAAPAAPEVPLTPAAELPATDGLEPTEKPGQG